ncbi:MAG TPA: tetratricopeptide repeat protein [Bryobacteraceae bacterium]|nr:tetratricopeptide repeat protein [Bryobacteraceae bacterium]
MRFVVLFALCGCLCAQPPDAAYEPLTHAYEALRARDYDTAVSQFLKAVDLEPRRASIRKDLAYTYIKIGENELARDQFHEAMQLDPTDTQVALEYAFLCNETKEQAEARRIFDRIRKTGNATAEQAFENIDKPLAEGIERWKKAIAMGADNFSAHFELATLAEQRDELPLAAEQYEKAWRLLPDRRSVLVDLGRVLKKMNRTADADAALLAASRGGEPRAAEMARELLPAHYPYVSEFKQALVLDPKNVELRRELGYLLLRMNREGDAEQQFRAVTEIAPDDLLSSTQLGFLLYARGDHQDAMPLFQRVLAGKDDDLANRVRAVLRLPQVLKPRNSPQPTSIDAKIMAKRSIKAGYMKDALKYLQVAHEADPGDFDIMLQLGWTNNILHQDLMAYRWFDLARRSPDPRIAAEANQAWHNLRGVAERFRTTAWLFPLYSTRWHDLFSYGQIKTEIRTKLPIRPYVSLRFIGDTRLTIGGAEPQYLSESSFIAGVGVTTPAWHGVTEWFEAGSAISYLKGHMLPDYRGGVSALHDFGHGFGSESAGWFAETGVDGVFVSRFGNDFLVYQQNRLGYTVTLGPIHSQFYWNGNFTIDSQRQDWANYGETGPGLRFHTPLMPTSTYFTLNLLHGAYFLHTGDTRRPNFNDLRAGFWYAFTR